jgi:serine/threonine protein kinase
VALKLLNPEAEGVGELARRLRDEARILGLLNHRAIVGVDGLIQLGGRWAVVMEYVNGVDLRVLLQHHALPVGAALELVAEVSGALAAARSAQGGTLQLVHRDIKPANIQLTASGEVKVLDFGIARADFQSREAHTQSLLFGSPPYMAPERLDFQDSPQGDIYSLGVVLHEALTQHQLGRTSARREGHEGTLERARAALDEALPGAEMDDIKALTLSCMAFEPADRPEPLDLWRRALELRRRLEDPWLADWSQQHIPALIAARGSDDHALCGAVLQEESGYGPMPGADTEGDTGKRDVTFELIGDTGSWSGADADETYDLSTPRSVTPASVTPPPAARPGALPPENTSSTFLPPEEVPAPVASGRAGWGVAAALVVALGIGGYWITRGEETPAEEIQPAEALPPEERGVPGDNASRGDAPGDNTPGDNAPGDASPQGDEPEDKPPEDGPPEDAASGDTRPGQSGPEEVAAPEGGGATGSEVGAVVVASAEPVETTPEEPPAVQLRSGGVVYSAGELPAGQYVIWASFEGKPLAPVGSIALPEGQVVTLNCMSGFTRCNPVTAP